MQDRYAYHCVLFLRMPLCISQSAFPVHAPMPFTVYFPSACLYAFQSLLSRSMPLCMSLGSACLHAIHCILSLCMPLCISLSTFPVHASTHHTVYFFAHAYVNFTTFPAHASMHFTLYLPYAFHCALSLRMPPCISVPTFPTQLSCAERNGFTRRSLRNPFGENKSENSNCRIVMGEP